MAEKSEKKVKFISIGTLVGKGKELIKKMKDQETLNMCRIYGLAAGSRVRNNKFGEQAEFRGQFEAVNMATGVVVRSSRLYLPSEAADEVEAGLKSDKDNKGVKFAYQVDLTRDDADTNRGYFYVVTSLLEPQQSDVLNDLRKQADVKPSDAKKK